MEVIKVVGSYFSKLDPPRYSIADIQCRSNMSVDSKEFCPISKCMLDGKGDITGPPTGFVSTYMKDCAVADGVNCATLNSWDVYSEMV
jgi:hypothetical protein